MWCWDVPLHLRKGPLSQHPMGPGPQKMLGEKLSKELGEWVGGWEETLEAACPLPVTDTQNVAEGENCSELLLKCLA